MYAAVIVFLLIFMARNHIMGYFFDRCIRDVKPYLSGKYETVLIADTRSDGSETLTSELPEDVGESLDHLFLVANFYYGPESRIFIYFENSSENYSLKRLGFKSKYPGKVFYAQMDASKMWRDDFLFFNGDKKLHYVDLAGVPGDGLRNSQQFSRLTDFVLMSK